MPRFAFALWLLALSSCGGPSRAVEEPSADAGPAWNEWTPETFARARREGRPILLSVQAGWCHWCHVMNDTTYRDPEVLARLARSFVLVRADGDARPDLAERYRRYAWPATVFLAPDGEQILALRGYRPPDRFAAILDDVVRAHAEGRRLEPDAGAEEPPAEDLDAIRRAVTAQLDGMYDAEGGGWGHRQRYPLAAPVEHALYRARVHGEAPWRERALFTLDRYTTLIDPVFGGMYQYSIPEVWDRPHFEKIVPVQAGAIRAFAEAYRATGDARWLEAAESIHAYVREQLRAPDGAFYASQDADLGGHGQAGPHVPGNEYYALDEDGRRALGLPRVDVHVYAATNGLLIEALANLHVATQRRAPLAEAVRAAERIVSTHRRPDGLFAHDADADDPVPYLADQAQMLAAFVALHQASGMHRWLEEAERLADAMIASMRDDAGGFVAHGEDPRAPGLFDDVPVPVLDNAVAARALLAMARLTDREPYREAALAALRDACRPSALRSLGRMVGELLLALEAARDGYLVLSVVGPEDPRTSALYDAALRIDEPTRLVELGRPGEGRYPYPGEPAVFLCSSQACSMPVFVPDELPSAVATFLDR
ncbi:MAG: thioredoxin domain-containing protein [Sandaracinaceae bacterium]|nr:thioredoxin domain-containing protein [Sandaracinaceae bacterium]